MKRIIRLTEGELVKIIEQMVVEPVFNVTKYTGFAGRTPKVNDGVDVDMDLISSKCEVKKTMEMIIKEIFSSLEKSSTSSSNEKVKKYINRLKNSMEGLGSTDDVYNVFREIKDKETISSVIKNWKSVTKSNESLYEWISSEMTVRWVVIYSILEKNKFYGVTFNPCIKERKLYN